MSTLVCICLSSFFEDIKEEMVFSQTLAPLWQRFLKNSPGSCKAGIVATCSTDERYVQPSHIIQGG